MVEGKLAPINNDPAVHNGFRFLIRFDKDKIFQNKKALLIEIDKLQIFLKA